jgi:hypothetical protein
MSKIKSVVMEIHELLDTTTYLCADVARITGAPLELVETIVDQRYQLAFGPYSKYCVQHEISA